MTDASQRLLDALLGLPREERLELFERLGDSLETDDPAELNGAWRDEIRQRVARVDAGEADLSELDDVVRELEREQASDERSLGAAR